MPRLLAAAITILILAVPVAVPVAALGADPAPVPDCHGTQVADKAGDSTNSLTNNGAGTPDSDLTAGWITYDPASGKAAAFVQVAELVAGRTDAPYDGISWEWQFNADGKARYLRAFEDVSGTAKYGWGEPRAVTDDQTTPRAGGATTGKLFPGKPGVIQIDIPMADMGLKPGSVFKGMALEVRQWDTLPSAVPPLPSAVPLYSPAPIYDTASGKGQFLFGPCTAGVAPPVATPVTPGTPGAPAAPQDAPKLNIKVTVPKLKANKLAKAKKFTVKLKGSATNLSVAMRAGNLGPEGKTLGTGKLAKLAGSGKLTIKLKGKPKKGTYRLDFTGTDAQGRKAAGSVGMKIS